MKLVECCCGTVYHLDNEKTRSFRCGKCSKTVVVLSKEKLSTSTHQQPKLVESPQRLAKWLFIVESTVGFFTLLMMAPTAYYLSKPEYAEIVQFVLILELVIGALLICSAVSFYLLSIQVNSLQSMMNFHQHNLQIFADQITRIFQMIRRRD